MEEIRIRKITFGSFVKLLLTAGLAFGVFVGVIILIIGLCGGNVSANIGDFRVEGVWGGILGLFLAPVLAAISYTLSAALLYWPFRLVLKLIRGIKLKVKVS